MNLATQVRGVLAKGPLPFRKLHEIVGGDDAKLSKAVYQMKYRGAAKISGDERTITLLTRKGAPPRKGKRSAGKKTVNRPYKRLADKHAPAANDTDLRALALDNYIGAGALLRQAIEDGVEDLTVAHGLRAALANHDRAEKLLAAVKS
jgi:hypothetical protein